MKITTLVNLKQAEISSQLMRNALLCISFADLVEEEDVTLVNLPRTSTRNVKFVKIACPHLHSQN